MTLVRGHGREGDARLKDLVGPRRPAERGLPGWRTRPAPAAWTGTRRRSFHSSLLLFWRWGFEGAAPQAPPCAPPRWSCGCRSAETRAPRVPYGPGHQGAATLSVTRYPHLLSPSATYGLEHQSPTTQSRALPHYRASGRNLRP